MPPLKVIGLREQAAYLRMRLPAFRTTVKGPRLTSTGLIRPSPLSESYFTTLTYRVSEQPVVVVDEPELIRRGGEPIPHMYDQERLCLYRPTYNEWTAAKPIATTIIPWAELWLYYYEVWHASGVWYGGGEEPDVVPPIRNSRDD